MYQTALNTKHGTVGGSLGQTMEVKGIREMGRPRKPGEIVSKMTGKFHVKNSLKHNQLFLLC